MFTGKTKGPPEKKNYIYKKKKTIRKLERKQNFQKNKNH